MAIDGVKIIDSDSAYDIYNDIIERYKDGEDVEKIKQDWLAQAEHFCISELFTEIYWSAFAYALWKIGALDDDIKTKTQDLLANGASAEWLKIDEKAQKQRQKVLDKLLSQIASENPRPLKRPKLKQPKTPYFEVGDVLSISFEKGYGIGFVSAVTQTPRKIEYHIATTRKFQEIVPTMQDFFDSQIACGKYNKDFALKTDNWITHKELGIIVQHFTKIGKIKLYPYELWVLSSSTTLEDFYDEIHKDKEAFGLCFKNTYELVREIVE